MGARKRPLGKLRAGRLLHILLSPPSLSTLAPLCSSEKKSENKHFSRQKNGGKLLPVMHTPPSLIARRKEEREKSCRSRFSHVQKSKSAHIFSSSQKIKGRKALQYFWGPPSTQCFPPILFLRAQLTLFLFYRQFREKYPRRKP